MGLSILKFVVVDVMASGSEEGSLAADSLSSLMESSWRSSWWASTRDSGDPLSADAGCLVGVSEILQGGT